MTCWDHSRRARRKRFFKLISDFSSSWNILLFRSPQIHQNKQIGTIFQTTLLFFSRPLIFHSRSKFLTEFGNTHTTPKEESTKRSWGRHGKPIKVRQLYLFFCKDQKHKSIYWGLMELKSHMEVRKLKQSHLEMTQTIIS